MFKQKQFLALGAVTLTALLLLSLPQRVTARLKLAAGSLFVPVSSLASTAEQSPADIADLVLPRRELLQEMDRLRLENQELKLQVLQNSTMALENEQLRYQIRWQRQAPWRIKLANVVMRDPANWWRTVQIDLGSEAGVTNNLPVLTSDGLVGRVSAVWPTRSQVVLIGDPSCRVSALVRNAEHDVGVLNADGTQDNTLADLTHLSGTAVLKPGEEVVTSGLGGVFPKDIPIGRIVDSRQVEFGMSTEARVKLWANLGTLEQVWVLFH
jgi:rod shape-determining protein MreC